MICNGPILFYINIMLPNIMGITEVSGYTSVSQKHRNSLVLKWLFWNGTPSYGETKHNRVNFTVN